MEVRLTSTEATAEFAEVLRRVRERGESFIIEGGGRAVCTIRPVQCKRITTFADLAAALQNGPHVDEEYLKMVEDYVAEVNRPAMPESPWDR